MGINKQSDVGADLQIGPTDRGMVRIYVAGGGVELPLDFEPDEAEEIAEELRAAAATARALAEAGASGAERARGRAPAGADEAAKMGAKPRKRRREQAAGRGRHHDARGSA